MTQITISFARFMCIVDPVDVEQAKINTPPERHPEHHESEVVNYRSWARVAAMESEEYAKVRQFFAKFGGARIYYNGCVEVGGVWQVFFDVRS